MQSCTKQNKKSSEERESVEKQSELEPVTKQEVLFIGSHENAHLPYTEKEGVRAAKSPLLALWSRVGPRERIQ